jgi:glutamate-1-semialdehyde 2,1-aminomutase
MDAVHLMRAATGRDRIIKVEGGYHGHHDSVIVSVLPEQMTTSARRPHRQRFPRTAASPRDMDLTTDRPVQRPAAVEAALDAHPGEVAGMILEPIMMNAGSSIPRTATSRR